MAMSSPDPHSPTAIPQRAELYLELALAHLAELRNHALGGARRGANARTARLVRRAVELEPTLLSARSVYVLALARSSQWEAALGELRRLVESPTTEIEGYEILAAVYEEAGEYARAAWALGAALERAPERLDLAHWLLDLAHDWGQPDHPVCFRDGHWWDQPDAMLTELVIPTYERLLEDEPDDADTWRGLGHALGRAGRYREPASAYGRALSLAPGDRPALEGHASALFAGGAFEDAIRAFETLRAVRGDHPYIDLRQGDAHFRMGRVLKAIEAYRRAYDDLARKEAAPKLEKEDEELDFSCGTGLLDSVRPGDGAWLVRTEDAWSRLNAARATLLLDAGDWDGALGLLLVGEDPFVRDEPAMRRAVALGGAEAAARVSSVAGPRRCRTFARRALEGSEPEAAWQLLAEAGPGATAEEAELRARIERGAGRPVIFRSEGANGRVPSFFEPSGARGSGNDIAESLFADFARPRPATLFAIPDEETEADWEAAAPIEELLEDARKAERPSGFQPGAERAEELYRLVLERAPGHPVATRGLERIERDHPLPKGGVHRDGGRKIVEIGEARCVLHACSTAERYLDRGCPGIGSLPSAADRKRAATRYALEEVGRGRLRSEETLECPHCDAGVDVPRLLPNTAREEECSACGAVLFSVALQLTPKLGRMLELDGPRAVPGLPVAYLLLPGAPNALAPDLHELPDDWSWLLRRGEYDDTAPVRWSSNPVSYDWWAVYWDLPL